MMLEILIVMILTNPNSLYIQIVYEDMEAIHLFDDKINDTDDCDNDNDDTWNLINIITSRVF